jgi:alanyl-tRNA synthetase
MMILIGISRSGIWCSCSTTATLSGELHALPAPSVDTGMGLERIAAVLQHVHSNYEIDLFTALISAVAKQLGASDTEDKSLRVIADHLRSTAFLIADGVMPGNEGRGYVLRRIIRRAIRHGNKLGAKEPFFAELVPELVAANGRGVSAARYPAVGDHVGLAGRRRAVCPDTRQRYGHS